LIVNKNKKCCKEILVLESRPVCKKKEKNCVKRGCRCKNVDACETNAHYRRIFVTPLRTNPSDIFDIYLSNLTNTYKEAIDFINVIGNRLNAESGDSKSKKFLLLPFNVETLQAFGALLQIPQYVDIIGNFCIIKQKCYVIMLLI
jgi:hypothetical protein